MPEILPIGWFHTGIAIVAIICGIISFKKHTVLAVSQTTGKIYFVGTLLAAGTALMIYQRGTFGPAHILAVLTLVALFGALLTEKTNLFGKFSPYLQAMGYSATFLFHMIPAITDGLMRLPIGDPIVTEFTDPLLQGFHLGFLLLYVVGLALQWRWLARQNQDPASTDPIDNA